MKDIEIVVPPPECSHKNTNGINGQTVNGHISAEPNDNVLNKESNECDAFVVVSTDRTCLKEKGACETGSGLKRLFSDAKFRHRFLHTACVFWSMVAMGWRVGLTGPTFPDLRQIINEDLSKSSWIFTAVSMGGLIGSVISGLAYDRFNKLALFTVIDVGLAATAAMTPWCNTFPLMFTAHLLHGGFVSALDTAATSDVVYVWGNEGGPFMQAVHFGFSLGAIISPFVSEPFLAKKIQRVTSNPFNSTPMPASTNISLKTSSNLTYPLTGLTSAFSNLTLLQTGMNSTQTYSVESRVRASSNDLQYVYEYGETRIYVTYFISSVVSLIAAVFFVVLAISVGSVYKKSVCVETSKKATAADKSVKHLLSRKLKLFFAVLMATLLLVSVINERHFRDFLMSFAMLSLGWTKTRGSHIVATFWIAYAVGRLSGIVTVKCMRQTYVFIMYIGILTLGTFGLLLGIRYDVNLLTFVATACVGVGESVLFASCFSWLSENVLVVTGKMTSAMFIVFSSGAMTFPLLAGYLMKNFDYMWFIYLQIVLVVIMNVILIVVIVTYRCVSKTNKR